MQSEIVLGAHAMEITREPVASNVLELIAKGNIKEVIGIYNKKPSTATLFIGSTVGAFSVGTVVRGVTSGATGTIVGFFGTVALLLKDVVGTFTEGESVFSGLSFNKAGVAAAPGTWNGVASTGGTGTGATFDVTDVTGVYDTVAFDSEGTGYLPGDVLTVAGTDLGGASPANDLTLTLTAVASATVEKHEATSHDGQWLYRYPVMTSLALVLYDDKRFEIELQDVSNKPLWSTGDLDGLNQAITDINAWLP